MKINHSLFNIPIINSVIEFDCTDSTNLKAKEFAKRGSVHGTLFVAHEQTKGRGRMDRHFISPKDDGIYMSVLLRPPIELSKMANITLVTALAISRAIRDICHLSPQIKWPNDILINGKKIAGILTESGKDYVIIGTGINVHNQKFDSDIKNTATSINLETGTHIDSFQLLYCILENFNSLYYEFINEPDLSFMQKEYNSLLVNMEQEIFIIPHHLSQNNSNPYTISTEGLPSHICKGIDSNGNLLCMNSDEKIISVNSGEVSLRGIHGYI